jgi:hypothetical protein
MTSPQPPAQPSALSRNSMRPASGTAIMPASRTRRRCTCAEASHRHQEITRSRLATTLRYEAGRTRRSRSAVMGGRLARNALLVMGADPCVLRGPQSLRSWPQSAGPWRVLAQRPSGMDASPGPGQPSLARNLSANAAVPRPMPCATGELLCAIRPPRSPRRASLVMRSHARTVPEQAADEAWAGQPGHGLLAGRGDLLDSLMEDPPSAFVFMGEHRACC